MSERSHTVLLSCFYSSTVLPDYIFFQFKVLIMFSTNFNKVFLTSATIMAMWSSRRRFTLHLIQLLLGLGCSTTQRTVVPQTTMPSPTPSQYPSPQANNSPGLRLRLAGHPRKHNEGRIELFHREEWGTVCDDDFSISNANVLCRQLGFVSATGWTHSAKYGKGQGEPLGKSSQSK